MERNFDKDDELTKIAAIFSCKLYLLQSRKLSSSDHLKQDSRRRMLCIITTYSKKFNCKLVNNIFSRLWNLPRTTEISDSRSRSSWALKVDETGCFFSPDFRNIHFEFLPLRLLVLEMLCPSISWETIAVFDIFFGNTFAPIYHDYTS